MVLQGKQKRIETKNVRGGARVASRLGARSAVLSVAAALVLSLAMFAAGCSSTPQQTLTVASLKGPTSIGLAAMIQDEGGASSVTIMDSSQASDQVEGSEATADEAQDSQAKYAFRMYGTADAIVADLVRGDVDVALIPANLAANLYKKTEGGIVVIDVNTLGVLYVVGADTSVQHVSDLAGRMVYMTGKGTVPQYTFDAELNAVGLSESDLTIEFKSEPAEVLAALAADPDALAVLPQPYVAAACAKMPQLSVLVDLTSEWEQTMPEGSGSAVTGVTVMRTEVLDEYPDAAKEFIKDHEKSIESVNKDAASAAELVVEAGILDNQAIAEKAIPQCNIVCISGDEMKSVLSGFLSVLYQENPSSVGGSLPPDEFYY